MIARTRLLVALDARKPGVRSIEAGAGYGKSVLLEQLRSYTTQSLIIVRSPLAGPDASSFVVQLADAARRFGHADVAELLVGCDPTPAAVAAILRSHDCSLAIDDVHLWGETLVNFAQALSETAGFDGLVVLVGRRMPALQNAVHLTSAEIAFTAEETAEVLAESGIAEAALALTLHEVTSGWPLAVGAIAKRMVGADPAAAIAAFGATESIVADLLGTLTSDLSEKDRRAAGALAALPFFDRTIADMMSLPGLTNRLADAGVPITWRVDGWAEISGQLDSYLAPGSTDVDSHLAKVVEHFVDSNELHAAITTCVAHGQTELAAATIAGFSLNQQTRLEPSTLGAAITAIGPAIDSHPRALQVQAQVYGSFGRLAEGLDCLERAAQVYGRVDPLMAKPDHTETLLELALWRAVHGDDSGARDLVSQCDEHILWGDSTLVEARAHDVRGLLLHNEGSASSLEASVEEMTKALAIWRRLGEPRGAAATTFRLAAGVLVSSGRRRRALELLDDLPNIGPMTLVNRAKLALERSIVLPYLGRAHEVPAVVGEARRIAGMLDQDWIISWTLWTEAVAMSIQGDTERVIAIVDEYEEAGHFLLNDFTQGLMWCEIAEALARCGHHDRAQATMARATAVDGHPEWYTNYFLASLDARAGRTQPALARLAPLFDLEEVEQEKRWSIALLMAYCHGLLGDADAAETSLARCHAELDLIGEPSLCDVVESRLMEQVRSARGDSVPALAELIEIKVFGTFSLSVNGQAVSPPRGHVSSLLKLLVLGNGRLVVDQAIDPLWPDADLELGRRRLRNVLKRLRESCGDIVERDGETLALREGVASDFARFLSAERQALSLSASRAVIEHAIQLAEGPLLPEDRYDDWAEAARDGLQDSLLGLLDGLAESAIADGEIDTAVAALRRADQLDLLSEKRARQAGDLLRSAGRQAAALELEKT